MEQGIPPHLKNMGESVNLCFQLYACFYYFFKTKICNSKYVNINIKWIEIEKYENVVNIKMLMG